MPTGRSRMRKQRAQATHVPNTFGAASRLYESRRFRGEYAAFRPIHISEFHESPRVSVQSFVRRVRHSRASGPRRHDARGGESRGHEARRQSLGRQGAGARGRPRQGRRRQAREVGRRGRAARQSACSARASSRIKAAPEGLPIDYVYVEAGSSIERELYLSLVVDRSSERIAVMASAAGGMDIEEVAHKTPEKILTLTLHPAAGLEDYPGPQARLRLRARCRRSRGSSRDILRKLDEAVSRMRREPRRGQPADRHERRPRRRARREDQHRGQRAVPPEAARRDARHEPRGRARARRARERPQLRLARRQHRVHGERRGPRDGDDGPDQAARRRARELPRRRRRRHGRARDARRSRSS